MLQGNQQAVTATGIPASSLTLAFARSQSEIREAQRLRYQVFAEEMGAQTPGDEPGLDADLFDAHCEHLLVRDARSGEVVGTYRLLTGARARYLGSFYADTEFDLTRLRHLQGLTIEIGRSCVRREYRSGAVIALLWSGITRYMQSTGHRYLMGCASLGMADGGHRAAAVYRNLAGQHLSPPEYRVFPRHGLPLEALDEGGAAVAPPLVRAYVRAGAWICGEPAWDPDFNTADLLMLLPVECMRQRYARHFLSSR